MILRQCAMNLYLSRVAVSFLPLLLFFAMNMPNTPNTYPLPLPNHPLFVQFTRIHLLCFRLLFFVIIYCYLEYDGALDAF